MRGLLTTSFSVSSTSPLSSRSVQDLAEYARTHPDTQPTIRVDANGATIALPNDTTLAEAVFHGGVEWRHVFNAEHPDEGGKLLTIVAGHEDQHLTLHLHQMRQDGSVTKSSGLLGVQPVGFDGVTARLPVHIPEVDHAIVIFDLLPGFPANHPRGIIDRAKRARIRLKTAGEYKIGTMDGGTRVETDLVPAGDTRITIGSCTEMKDNTIGIGNSGTFVRIGTAEFDGEDNPSGDLSDLWEWDICRDSGCHVGTLIADSHYPFFRDPLPTSLQHIASSDVKAASITPFLNGTITIDTLANRKSDLSDRNVAMAARSTWVGTQEYVASAIRGDAADPNGINQITITQTVQGENGRRCDTVGAFSQHIGEPVDQLADGRVQFYRLEKNIIVARTADGANLCGFQIPEEGTIHLQTLAGLINQVLHHRAETAENPASEPPLQIDNNELAEVYTRLQSPSANTEEPTAQI